MDAHLEALNKRDPDSLARTLHFPHVRLSNGVLTIWETAETYFEDFLDRAGDEWGYTEWGQINVVRSDFSKVHLDVEVNRYQSDGILLTNFHSLWVIACIDGHWAAQMRSSFAGGSDFNAESFAN